MHFRTGLVLALASVTFFSMSLPAVSRPTAKAHVQQQHKHAKKHDAKRPAEQPSTAAAPRSNFAAAPEFWHSARSHAVPALVREARKYIGTNPTDRKRLWCARFMNFVLAKLGYEGTDSDAAKSFADYGQRISEPRVGAIAVLSRGRKGGHVGVVSGVKPNGDPIIISGNHTPQGVGEGVYARSRVIAYVLPTAQASAAVAHGEVKPGRAHPSPEPALTSPIDELIAAIESEKPRARPNRVLRTTSRAAEAVVPHRTVQQTPGQQTGERVNPISELIGSFERRSPQGRVL